MYLRKLLARKLLNLYPATWRKEYGEEMRSMLLAQPLTASVIGDAFLNAMRQNIRRPDPWIIAALCLICWRSFWILLPSITNSRRQPGRGLNRSIAASFCWSRSPRDAGQ